MKDKKQNIFQSPDLNKLQKVAVDFKTTIFIAIGADPNKARNKYLEQINSRYIKRQ